jgi:hypothetical protein
VLYLDNTSAIKLTKNLEYHKRSKHIEVQRFYVRERYLDDCIGIQHTDRKKQMPDLLTKPIERVQFEVLCHEIGNIFGEQ